MVEKTCLDCVYVDVCENKFSWLDQDNNTKYITCHHFKDKTDVVEVVRCKDCKCCEHSYPSKAVGEEALEGWYCNIFGQWRKPDDFCSYGEKRSEEE